MKKILFISSSILLTINSNAQTAFNYRSYIKNIFQNVDKTQIATGLLKEWVCPNEHSPPKIFATTFYL